MTDPGPGPVLHRPQASPAAELWRDFTDRCYKWPFNPLIQHIDLAPPAACACGALGSDLGSAGVGFTSAESHCESGYLHPD